VRRRTARVASAATAALTAGAAVALLAGCGGRAPTDANDRQYSANAAGLIEQLHGDLVTSSAEVGDLGDAQRVLRRPSDLYSMLMAYGDFGGCRTMLRNVGHAGTRFGRVQTTLASACRYLERGSRLFQTAATRSDAAALLAAARTSLLASPLLIRAQAELADATGGRG
jgi:hypothetical protein